MSKAKSRELLLAQYGLTRAYAELCGPDARPLAATFVGTHPLVGMLDDIPGNNDIGDVASMAPETGLRELFERPPVRQEIEQIPSNSIRKAFKLEAGSKIADVYGLLDSGGSANTAATATASTTTAPVIKPLTSHPRSRPVKRARDMLDEEEETVELEQKKPIRIGLKIKKLGPPPASKGGGGGGGGGDAPVSSPAGKRRKSSKKRK